MIDFADLLMAVTIRNSRMGIAQSQLTLGNWTPEFYAEKMLEYERQFQESIRISQNPPVAP